MARKAVFDKVQAQIHTFEAQADVERRVAEFDRSLQALASRMNE